MNHLDQAAGGAEFVQLVKSVALSKGRHVDAIRHAEDSPRGTHRVASVLRAASSAGQLSDPSWAGALSDYRTIANGFLESLRNLSAFNRLLERDMRRVPPRTRIAATVLGATGSAVEENAPKPVSRLTLAGPQLELRKAVSIVVVSDDLMRSAEPGADAFIAAELRGSVATATDAAFVAGLAIGAPTFASSGNSAANILADIRTLLGAVRTGATSRLYLLVNSATAKLWSTVPTASGDIAFPDMAPGGGSIAGIPVIVTDGLAGSTALLIDASRIVAGSDTVVVDSAAHATLQLDDTPTDPPNATTVFQSLWQRNLVAWRSERFFGFEKVSTDSVAVLTGIGA